MEETLYAASNAAVHEGLCGFFHGPTQLKHNNDYCNETRTKGFG